MNYIGYIENSYLYGFQIPIFKIDNKYYFQRIASDNTYIEGFDETPIEPYVNEIVYSNPIEKNILDFAIYVVKFDGEVTCCSRIILKQHSNKFFSQFDPETNLFFFRDFMSLYKDFRNPLLKLFYKINESEFFKNDLIEYVTLIFSVDRLKVETLILEQIESKVKIFQLFEVKYPRSDYYRFIKWHRSNFKLLANQKDKKDENTVYYDLFEGKKNYR